MMVRSRSGDTDGKNKPARKQGAVGASDDAPFRGYINVNLSDDQKVMFDKWFSSQAPFEALEAFVGDGVNLSLKRDPKQSGFLASATQRSSASPNAGLVVTARGREAAVAWGRVLYILTILAHAERWEDVQPLANPDRW